MCRPCFERAGGVVNPINHGIPGRPIEMPITEGYVRLDSNNSFALPCDQDIIAMSTMCLHVVFYIYLLSLRVKCTDNKSIQNNVKVAE